MLQWPLRWLAIALAYGALGWLSLRLAIPGYQASALYPSAGIALVSVLVYGSRAVPAVALGALLAHAATMAHATTPWDLPSAAIVSAGAALQAMVGAALVKRFVRQPLTLSEPRDIAAFFGWGAFGAGLINASIATTVLTMNGALTQTTIALTWFTWWMGDSLGTVIAAPVALTLIGRPRDEWAPRRLNTGLTLSVTTALLAAMIVLVARWEQERIQNSFEREAVNASATLSFQLQQPLNALEALRGVYIASDEVSHNDVRRAVKSWLDGPGHLQAMGYHERVARADVPQFEERVRAESQSTYHVHDRTDAPPPASALGDDVIVMRHVEPLGGNEAALGVNVLSIPAARTAVEAAIRTDKPVATAGFTLSQDTPASPGGEQTGIVIYHAIYRGVPQTAKQRVAAARGVVFVTLRVDDMLRSVRGRLPHYLKVCVVDTDPLAKRRRLSGPAGCEAPSAALLHVRTLAFAGRQWELRITADALALPAAGNRDAWLFSLVGLLSAALLGALLLTVTGRTRRIEAAVRERTAALVQQVHEREQAQAALRDSETRFRNIFNNVPIGVFYTDLQGRVRQTNPRFCELVGYSDSELLGMCAADFTHPDDKAHDVDFLARLLSGDLPLYRSHTRYIAKGGRLLWVQSTVSVLRDEQGRPSRIVGAVEDITEHLLLADAQRAREAAEASNRAKSEFLSRMSHELRTPLNAMLGFSQLLEMDRRQPIAETQRPWVAQIQQAGWHLLDMINDMLDLSRIESGNLRLSIEPLDVRALLAASTPLVESHAQKRGIAMSESLPVGARRICADATRVKQIFTNLLSNAVKYNTDGGRIHVAGRRVGPMVEIAIIDTGLGMTPSQMDNLFQPFNRLGRERSSQEGTGIGLVISQRLAELMGGSLSAHSVEGQGSSFLLTLPAADDPDLLAPAPPPPQQEAARYNRRIVHYVEDNETNIEVMRGMLSQRPQVALETSLNGLDGLAAIRAHHPDLILLDMHLPDISGLDLLRRLKADAATADIAVVVVSADALASQMSAALDAGAQHYLTKPFSIADLLATLDSLLERADTQFG